MVLAAVVFIPFLLPQPGSDANATSAEALQQSGTQVFRSKIEPLNLSQGGTLAVVTGDNKVAETPNSNSNASKPALVTSIKKKKVPESSAAESPPEPAESDVDPTVKVVMTSKKSEPVKKLAALDKKSDDSTVKTTQSNDAPVKKQKTPETSDNGWAVRVGTFSKKSNVDSVSSLLKDSGFNAHHSKVNTNLGKATRIWLGPYSDKATAEKVSVRLKALTGEKGYVTKHNS